MVQCRKIGIFSWALSSYSDSRLKTDPKPSKIRAGALQLAHGSARDREETMNKKIVSTIVVTGFAMVVVLGAPWLARAQNPKAPYPSMAPLDQYLMPDRNAEIALARSAAPASISSEAAI